MAETALTVADRGKRSTRTWGLAGMEDNPSVEIKRLARGSAALTSPPTELLRRADNSVHYEFINSVVWIEL
jgi:hypothetical protein